MALSYNGNLSTISDHNTNNQIYNVLKEQKTNELIITILVVVIYKEHGATTIIIVTLNM